MGSGLDAPAGIPRTASAKGPGGCAGSQFGNRERVCSFPFTKSWVNSNGPWLVALRSQKYLLLRDCQLHCSVRRPAPSAKKVLQPSRLAKKKWSHTHSEEKFSAEHSIGPTKS